MLGELQLLLHLKVCRNKQCFGSGFGKIRNKTSTLILKNNTLLHHVIFERNKKILKFFDIRSDRYPDSEFLNRIRIQIVWIRSTEVNLYLKLELFDLVL